MQVQKSWSLTHRFSLFHFLSSNLPSPPPPCPSLISTLTITVFRTGGAAESTDASMRSSMGSSMGSSMERDPEDSLAEKYDVEGDGIEMDDHKTVHQETHLDENGSKDPVQNGTQNSTNAERKVSVQVRWKHAAQASMQKEEELPVSKDTADTISELPKFNRKSIFLRDGDAHAVWRPKRRRPHPALATVVDQMVQQTPLQSSLRERQRTLLYRVRATQEVLREVDFAEEMDVDGEVEATPAEPHSRRRWRKAKDSVVSELHKSKTAKKEKGHQFHDVVSQYMAHMNKSLDVDDLKDSSTFGRRSLNVLSRQISGQLAAAGIPKSAPVPIAEWKKLVELAKVAEESPAGITLASPPPGITRPLSLAMENGEKSRSPSTSGLSNSRDMLITDNEKVIATKPPQRLHLKKQVVIVDSEDQEV